MHSQREKCFRANKELLLKINMKYYKLLTKCTHPRLNNTRHNRFFKNILIISDRYGELQILLLICHAQGNLNGISFHNKTPLLSNPEILEWPVFGRHLNDWQSYARPGAYNSQQMIKTNFFIHFKEW